MKQFAAPTESLGRLSPESAAKLIEVASDITLIVDRDGVISDFAVQSDGLFLQLEGCENWRGRPWIEIVSEESRSMAATLLADAADHYNPKWRQLNHPSSRFGSVPLQYAAVKANETGRTVIFGRDLQPIAALQRRLVEAQQSMERDYLRLRRMETRYRFLFEMSSAAVIILDASNHKIVETNPGARDLLGDTARRMLGRAFPDIFHPESASAVHALLGAVRAGGRTDHIRGRLAQSGREIAISVSLFREDMSSLFLVQIAAIEPDGPSGAMSGYKANFLNVLESLPDGFVVIGPDLRILTTNGAFLEMAQLATEAQAQGEPLKRWLGRPGADLDLLIANLHEHGSVRLFTTTLRGEYGGTAEVEISAVSVPSGGQTCIGLTIRDIGRRLTTNPRTGRELPRTMDQLTELIGRVSLKDLVRETTDVIERLCIETALEITSDNRASAAEMLGLSRQSLYTKLRRFGLNPEVEGEDQG